MKINIFEGARRIEYLIIGVIIITGICLGFTSNPYFQLRYSIPFVDEDAVRTETDECEYEDALETVNAISPKGHKYSISLCFKATHLNNGHVFNTFLEDGNVYVAEKYSSQAIKYRNDFAKSFRAPSRDVSELDKRYWILRIKDGLSVFGIALGCAVLLWVGSWIIGWIVRGFVGIPMGKDFKA